MLSFKTNSPKSLLLRIRSKGNSRNDLFDHVLVDADIGLPLNIFLVCTSALAAGLQFFFGIITALPKPNNGTAAVFVSGPPSYIESEQMTVNISPFQLLPLDIALSVPSKSQFFGFSQMMYSTILDEVDAVFHPAPGVSVGITPIDENWMGLQSSRSFCSESADTKCQCCTLSVNSDSLHFGEIVLSSKHIAHTECNKVCEELFYRTGATGFLTPDGGVIVVPYPCMRVNLPVFFSSGEFACMIDIEQVEIMLHSLQGLKSFHVMRGVNFLLLLISRNGEFEGEEIVSVRTISQLQGLPFAEVLQIMVVDRIPSKTKNHAMIWKLFAGTGHKPLKDVVENIFSFSGNTEDKIRSKNELFGMVYCAPLYVKNITDCDTFQANLCKELKKSELHSDNINEVDRSQDKRKSIILKPGLPQNYAEEKSDKLCPFQDNLKPVQNFGDLQDRLRYTRSEPNDSVEEKWFKVQQIQTIQAERDDQGKEINISKNILQEKQGQLHAANRQVKQVELNRGNEPKTYIPDTNDRQSVENLEIRSRWDGSLNVDELCQLLSAGETKLADSQTLCERYRKELDAAIKKIGTLNHQVSQLKHACKMLQVENNVAVDFLQRVTGHDNCENSDTPNATSRKLEKRTPSKRTSFPELVVDSASVLTVLDLFESFLEKKGIASPVTRKINEQSGDMVFSIQHKNNPIPREVRLGVLDGLLVIIEGGRCVDLVQACGLNESVRKKKHP